MACRGITKLDGPVWRSVLVRGLEDSIGGEIAYIMVLPILLPCHDEYDERARKHQTHNDDNNIITDAMGREPQKIKEGTVAAIELTKSILIMEDGIFTSSFTRCVAFYHLSVY